MPRRARSSGVCAHTQREPRCDGARARRVALRPRVRCHAGTPMPLPKCARDRSPPSCAPAPPRAAPEQTTRRPPPARQRFDSSRRETADHAVRTVHLRPLSCPSAWRTSLPRQADQQRSLDVLCCDSAIRRASFGAQANRLRTLGVSSTGHTCLRRAVTDASTCDSVTRLGRKCRRQPASRLRRVLADAGETTRGRQPGQVREMAVPGPVCDCATVFTGTVRRPVGQTTIRGAGDSGSMKARQVRARSRQAARR